MKAKETVQTLLNNVRNPETVRDLCAQDVTYVSLNYTNPDLHKIMPWCGTGHGVDAITKTFHDVSEYWRPVLDEIRDELLKLFYTTRLFIHMQQPGVPGGLPRIVERFRGAPRRAPPLRAP